MRKGKASCPLAGYPSFGMPLFLFTGKWFTFLKKVRAQKGEHQMVCIKRIPKQSLESTLFIDRIEVPFKENNCHPKDQVVLGLKAVKVYLEKELGVYGISPSITYFELITGIYEKEDGIPRSLFLVEYRCLYSGFESGTNP